MKRATIRLAIVAIWLLSLGWLIRFEAYPERFTHVLDGYKGLVGHDILVSDSWMKILYADKPVGYAHTHIDTVDSDPVRHYQITYDTYLTIDVAGVRQSVDLSMESYLDRLHDLQEFTFSVATRDFSVNVRGHRKSGRTFAVRIDAGAFRSERLFELPEGVILYSPMTEMTIRRLTPGQQLTILTVDPVSLSRMNIVVRALRHERILIEGVEHDTTVLVSEYQGSRMNSWLSEKDGVLKQETPFGWTMVRCSPEEATRATSVRQHEEAAGERHAGTGTNAPVDHSDITATAELIRRLVSGIDLDAPTLGTDQAATEPQKERTND